MALKGDRVELDTLTTFYINETGDPGLLVCFLSGASGAALDSSSAVVGVASDSSGAKPAGILLNQVVNIDLSKFQLDGYKDQIQVGQKCTILRKGRVVTNNIRSGNSPAVGETAYFDDNGALTNTNSGFGSDPVGKWLSSKDSDGYATIDINIP